MPKFSAYMKGGDGSVGPPGASFISGIVSNINLLPDYPVPVNQRIYLVGDSNPKSIYVFIPDNPENEDSPGEWIFQGYTASKIEQITADVETLQWDEQSNVEVNFTTNEQLNYINFDFSLPTSRPPDFDTPSISTKRISYTTAPTASITTSGPYYNKKFEFNFGIPEGVPGGFSTYQPTTASILGWSEDPTVLITPIESTPSDSKSFQFDFGIPEGRAGGFSANQHVTVSTLDTGAIATVDITPVTTSPEYAKEFNFHFGLPKGDALAIYDGITFTSTENGIDYYWGEDTIDIDGKRVYPLIFNRGTVKKLPIYIYNNNKESIASTFKISATTIEYEADEKFDGNLYLMMPATLQSIEIGSVTGAGYGVQPSVSISTGSTSSKIILDFIIPENGYNEREVINSISTDVNSLSTLINNKIDDAPDDGITYGRNANTWSRQFIPYGICNSLSTISDKYVEILTFPLDGIPTTGDTILVRFTEAGTDKVSTQNTLRINSSTTPIPIIRYGTTRTGTTAGENTWEANSVILFTYDDSIINGGAWIWQYYKNNTYNLSQNNCPYGNFIADHIIYRYQLLFHTSRDHLSPLNSNDNNINTTKTMYNIEFDPFEKIYYYDETTKINKDESFNNNRLAISKSSVNLRYTFNIGDNPENLVTNKDIYLICEKQQNGNFKILNNGNNIVDNPLTQELTTQPDGKYYIKLGRTITDNNYSIGLYYEKPIFYHDGTAIREYIKPLANLVLEGIPTAPTATTGTNTNQIATTEYTNNTVEPIKADIGLVENTDIAIHDILKGQYVIWKNSLYKANQAISNGSELSNNNLISITTGGLNALTEDYIMPYKPGDSIHFNNYGGSFTFQTNGSSGGRMMIPLSKPISTTVSNIKVYGGFMLKYNGTNINYSIPSSNKIEAIKLPNGILFDFILSTSPFTSNNGGIACSQQDDNGVTIEFE